MQSPDVDVIVIGGGAAGLEAAMRLSEAGRKVVLIEGRERLGGRIHTLHEPGWEGPVELGAEFIHGGNRVLMDLLRQAKLTRVPVGEQHWWVENGRRRLMPDTWERIDGVMSKIGPKYRRSFASWLSRRGQAVSSVDQRLAETFVQGFQGAPLELMSAHSLFEATKEEEEQLRLKRGYGSLVEALATKLDRRRVRTELATVVERIEWRRGFVRVHSRSKSWTARVVLVTVPLGVLRAGKGEEGAIAFTPELADKRRLLEKLPPGHAIRVIVRFRKDIWRRGVMPKELRGDSGRAFGFLHSDERHFPVWWTLAPRPVIVGWTGGPGAESLAGRSPDKIFGAALRTLAKLLSCSEADLTRSIVDWCTHDWSADPLTRGAYSFSVAGEESAPKRLAKPVARTIFFAGEATADPLELGTVHGALASGQRAAKEILASF